MYFKQFLHDDLGCSSYFVASRLSREALVVDPQLDVQPYLDLASERGYRIKAIIDTHLHADHVSGNRSLAALTGARLYLHEDADVVFSFEKLRDGEEIHIGQLILRVVHTPGHRPEAISLLLINPPRSPEPSMVLSGDTLFVGDVGRPDFGGPDGAVALFSSVQRLLRLEDWVEVFPAHFEGSCGKGMCGRPSSTIGFERRYNPVLQLARSEFLSFAGETPARPLNMTAIMAANRGVAEFHWNMHFDPASPPSVSIDEAVSWLRANDGAAIIDVREPVEYEAGHLPDAVLLPQAELASRLAEVPREPPVLVVCATGNRSSRATAFLRANGYDNAVNLAGGTSGWQAAGNPVRR